MILRCQSSGLSLIYHHHHKKIKIKFKKNILAHKSSVFLEAWCYKYSANYQLRNAELEHIHSALLYSCARSAWSMSTACKISRLKSIIISSPPHCVLTTQLSHRESERDISHGLLYHVNENWYRLGLVYKGHWMNGYVQSRILNWNRLSRHAPHRTQGKTCPQAQTTLLTRGSWLWNFFHAWPVKKRNFIYRLSPSRVFELRSELDVGEK